MASRKVHGLFVLVVFSSALPFSQVVPTVVGTPVLVSVVAGLSTVLLLEEELTVRIPKLALSTFFPLAGMLFVHVFLFNFKEASVAVLPAYTFFVAGVMLFVIPYEITAETAYGYVARVGILIGLIGLPVVIFGQVDYGLFSISSNAGGIRTFRDTLPPDTVGPLLSIYRNPNVTGQLLFVAVIGSIGEWLRQRTLVSTGLVILNSVFLYLTESRGAMIAGAAGVTALLAYRHISRRVFLTGTVFAYVGITAFVVGTMMKPEIVPPIIDLTGRGEIWRATIQVVRNTNVVFGAGLYGGGILEQVGGVNAVNPHSTYLQMLMWTGVAGLVLWITLFWGSLLDGIYRNIDAVPVAVGVGLVVRGIFEAINPFGTATGAILLTLTIGYLISSGPRHTIRIIGSKH